MIRDFSSILSVVIAAILINAITGCGGSDDVIGDDYLPIAVGSSWTFIDPERPRTSDNISITGITKLNNGETAFISTTSDGEEGYLSRTANNLILFHQTINDLQGELIYSPPIKVGTTWQGREGEARVVTQENVNTPAGIFQNCFRIDVHIVNDDDYYSIWLAKNVGPVKLAVIDISHGDIEDTVVLEAYNTR